MKKLFLGMGLLVSSLIANNQFEININNETIEVAGSLDLKGRVSLPASSEYTFDFRYLRTENEELGEDTNYILNAGFKVIDSISNTTGSSFGIGMDALYTDTKNDTFIAVPFTLYANYTFNSKIFIDANLKFAPKILSFEDADTYSEIRSTVNYAITSNATIYAGARYIEADFKNYELNYDKKAFAGFKFSF